MPAPLLIADVPWLLYRAYFSLPKSIAGADGQPVNALLGTVNALLSVLEARPSRAVAACFGAEQATYRVALYPGYHAQREPMPPELAAQWGKAPALLESFGWTVGTSDELEADDVMFSFARAETAADGHALLLTGAGDIVTLGEYGQAKITGLEAMGGFDIVVTSKIAVKVTGQYTRIGYVFTGNGAMANDGAGHTTVGGAADSYIGGALTLAVFY